jgi:hypothetical protein
VATLTVADVTTVEEVPLVATSVLAVLTLLAVTFPDLDSGGLLFIPDVDEAAAPLLSSSWAVLVTLTLWMDVPVLSEMATKLGVLLNRADSCGGFSSKLE